MTCNQTAITSRAWIPKKAETRVITDDIPSERYFTPGPCGVAKALKSWYAEPAMLNLTTGPRETYYDNLGRRRRLPHSVIKEILFKAAERTGT